MNKTTMKELHEQVEEFGAVGTAGDLYRGVPLLCDGIARVRAVSASLTALSKLLGKLSEKCSKYVLEHPACLDNGIETSAIGVKSGDITIDGKTYHFASGFGTPVREDGGKLTQEFLTNLPDGWFKVMAKLDTTGIERLVGTANMSDQLKNYGLVRPANNVWTEKVAAIGDDYSD